MKTFWRLSIEAACMDSISTACMRADGAKACFGAVSYSSIDTPELPDTHPDDMHIV